MSRNNTYQADLREMKFVLWEQMKFNELLSETSFYDGWDSETCNMVIDQAMKFTVNEIGPIFSATDQEGPIFDPTDGSVTLAPFFKEAYNKALEAGFQSLMVSTESGGQGAPYSLVTTVFEMISGAGPTLFMLLTAGCAAIEIIDNHGSQEQKEMWIPKLASGEWNATMVLSEPDAGSDVGNIRTKAVKQSDGSYLIKGTKIWISQGEHDANENIVHMVLARAEGAPAGTKGLSLFIVPKHRVDKSGNTTSIHNDISCIGIEHKMGIHGSPTCTLNFGENDACQG
ncbi:MAG: acyl-CoA dehydrogenase family protein, partial [Ignavibacteriales bacterium]